MEVRSDQPPGSSVGAAMGRDRVSEVQEGHGPRAHLGRGNAVLPRPRRRARHLPRRLHQRSDGSISVLDQRADQPVPTLVFEDADLHHHPGIRRSPLLQGGDRGDEVRRRPRALPRVPVRVSVQGRLQGLQLVRRGRRELGRELRLPDRQHRAPLGRADHLPGRPAQRHVLQQLAVRPLPGEGPRREHDPGDLRRVRVAPPGRRSQRRVTRGISEALARVHALRLEPGSDHAVIWPVGRFQRHPGDLPGMRRALPVAHSISSSSTRT